MNLDSRLSSALHALVHMARRSGPVTSEELGRSMQANPVVVRRTMAGLREAGLVRAEKGRGGGWSIHRDPAAITVRAVHAALGEPSVVASGLRSRLPGCLVEEAVNSALDGAFGEAEALVLDRLGAITLARLVDDVDRLARARDPHQGAPPTRGETPVSTPPDVIQAFDAHAEGYDRTLTPLLPLKGVLHLLLQCQLAGLPDAARVLVVGAGTGAEVRYLAPLFPRWTFVLVDPAQAMLAVAQRHALAEGFVDRCAFHAGRVATLEDGGFDAATSVLVSHFLTDAGERQAYFADIARRLRPGGLLFNADLCAETAGDGFAAVMDLWLTLTGMPEERRASFRGAFGRDVAAHGPRQVEAMIARAGFSTPVPVFQAALIRAWTAVRAGDRSGGS